jgi:hypothetical protein
VAIKNLRAAMGDEGAQSEVALSDLASWWAERSQAQSTRLQSFPL